MKRSEMVELIAKRLNPIGVSEETCEEVLSILEKAGMLPPKSKLSHIDAYDHGWEPEEHTQK